MAKPTDIHICYNHTLNLILKRIRTILGCQELINDSHMACFELYKFIKCSPPYAT